MSNYRLICPNCGSEFTPDNTTYNSIADQIRDQVINDAIARTKQEMLLQQQAAVETATAKAELAARTTIEQKDSDIHQLQLTIEATKKKANDAFALQKNRFDKTSAEKDTEIARLQKELDLRDDAQKAAIARAVSEEKESSRNKDMQIAALKTQIEDIRSQTSLEVSKAVSTHERTEAELKAKLASTEATMAERESALKEKTDAIIKEKDDEIARYRDFKAKQSVKLLGESLEQHCATQFNMIRPALPKGVYFEKDNDVSKASGSKGDFVFREEYEGTEVISIMFEMKNEADTSTYKHKNEDFLAELDKDRHEKNCDYAILVSMLEPDSELYNQGIVDMSHRFPKMFVIRPQFFIPIIMILREAAMDSIEYKQEIARMKAEDIDVTNFTDALEAYKASVSKGHELATKSRDNAIAKIDKIIASLQSVKTDLEKMDKHMAEADNKAEKLTIKKLTKKAPSVAALLDEVATSDEKPAALPTPKDISADTADSLPA